MQKKHLIRFLIERKRGAYTWLVEMYRDTISAMSVTAAMELIKEDLAKESGTNIELRYFSLARAVSRFKKTNALNSTARKMEFKDANELRDGQLGPGKFRIGESEVKVGQ